MRVAVVAPPWYSVPPSGYGGIEEVVALLVDGLVARGHRVTLIAAGPTSTRAQTVLTSYPQPPSARIGEALPEVVHAAFVRRALADLDVDVVHDHSIAGPLLAYGRSVPTVVTAHNDISGEPGAVLRHLGSDVAVVTVSRAQRRLGDGVNVVDVVHNAVDPSRYRFRAHKEGFVLFLGRTSEAKAPHLAIDAARAAGVPIVLAAKCIEPSEHEYFEREILPRMGRGVSWLGEVEQSRKRQLLAAASGLVFPIRWEEPFGLVMVEAMVSGTPVVALRRGAVDEVVVHGTTGWVCDDPADLADAVRRLPELSPEACREHAVDGFAPARMVERYERVYAAVLRQGRVSARAS